MTNEAFESSIVESSKRAIKKLGGEVRKLKGSKYSVRGDPDLFGCFRGRAFVIECKQPGKGPSPLQRYRLKQWRRTGAIGGVAHSAKEAVAILLGACPPLPRGRAGKDGSDS